MELSVEQLAALIGLGVFIGSLTGMFGIGGAFIATPVMITVIGIESTLAIGCSMGFTLINGVLSGTHHFRAGNYSKWASPPVAIGAGAGILVGFLLHLYFRNFCNYSVTHDYRVTIVPPRIRSELDRCTEFYSSLQSIQ